MGAGTTTTGVVTLVTVAPKAGSQEAQLTAAPMHHQVTVSGVKLKLSRQETSQVTNHFR